MPKNRVQFQKGMSLGQFMSQYGTEAQCQQALFSWRWPKGFVCPACAEAGGHALKARELIQCKSCRYQCSLTSGSLFASTKLSLRVWFLALYLITQAKNGISTVELARTLGVSQNSAWLLKHKLMQAMKEREAGRLLSGQVQLDDAYWGGKGRGKSGKRALVAAVQTDERGYPQRMRLSCVRGFRLREIARWSKAHLSPGTHVRSDGLWCFAAVRETAAVTAPCR
jgi:transposase-like protein